MEPIKIVMRYVDGRIVKGFTTDFAPNKTLFHVRPVESAATDKGVEISLKQLKAVFFVRDFSGDPSHDESNEFSGAQPSSGRKVEVTFFDEEVLVGTTLGYDPGRPGFFVTPADPESNNLRVFVVASAMRKFRFLS
jgi:hypothetical protein